MKSDFSLKCGIFCFIKDSIESRGILSTEKRLVGLRKKKRCVNNLKKKVENLSR